MGGTTLDGVGHGSVLAGRYRLEDRLHAGSGDSLWRAVDETLDRQVNVRVIPQSHRHAADMIDAARRAALVDDPRLARVLDVGQTSGLTYIVTEHVQGRPLTEFLRNGQLPAETARRIVGEAAQALERAGTRGLHHLKLTTGSICIVPDGTIKLLGTAIEGAAAGVEQEDADEASRTDTVGLVRLLYAGLTGRWPGTHGGPIGSAPRVTGRAVAPAELVAGVPADLDTLCTQTLGRSPAGPRTPGELAARLSPWARPAPMTDPQGLMVNSPERPVPPAPRRPAGEAATTRADDDAPVDDDAPAGDEAPVENEAAVDDGRSADNDGQGPEDTQETASAPAPTATPTDGTPLGTTEAAGEDHGDTVTPPSGAQHPDPQHPEHPETAPSDVATLRAAARARGIDPDRAVGRNIDLRGAESTPFSVDAPSAQPPLVQAPAFPVPGDHRATHRVTGRVQHDLAWPTPAPAPPTPGQGAPPVAGNAAPSGSTTSTPPRYDQASVRDPAVGVQRLDPAPPPSLGSHPHTGWSGVDRDDERLGPFLPPVPVGRPPRDQARLAIAIIAGLVVVGLILSLIALRGLFGSGSDDPTTAASPVASDTATASSSPGSTATVPAEPVEIAGVKALDPQGDGIENDATAARSIDGDSRTAWRSERYDTPQFGGLDKKGVGLLVDLGTTATVNEVDVQHVGTDGSVELRTATDPTFDSSTAITTTQLNGGKLVITLTQPVSTRYLILWFTKVTEQTDGENRLLVSEISVR